VRYYCWNNVLEESVLNDCTPEVKTHVTPALSHVESEAVYQSYTAHAVKYPEVEVVSHDVQKEINVHHDDVSSIDIVSIILIRCTH